MVVDCLLCLHVCLWGFVLFNMFVSLFIFLFVCLGLVCVVTKITDLFSFCCFTGGWVFCWCVGEWVWWWIVCCVRLLVGFCFIFVCLFSFLF